MALALFDLDNTLLNGDSDHSWGLFLARVGAVDPQEQARQQDYFYKQYQDGVLDILKFLEYQLSPLTKFSISQLKEWRYEFIESVIKPMIVTGKPELLELHRSRGDKLVIITATNDFITRPIADELGVETLIATRAEMVDGEYTGKCAGTPCFQDGKVDRLKQWLSSQEEESSKTEPEQHRKESEHSLGDIFNSNEPIDSYFYSDSINDLPLLEWVDRPIAVTPDDRLRAYAIEQDWQIID